VLAVLVLAAALVAVGVRAWRRDPPGARTVLVILLAVATPLGIAALSPPGDRSFLLPRNLIASLPALAVPIGWLLVALRSRLAVAATAAFLLVLAVGAGQALDPGHRRSPYRYAAHLVDAWARPDDPVIQFYFLPVKGSLATGRQINFARPHPLRLAGGCVRGRRVRARAPDWARVRGGAAARWVQARASLGTAPARSRSSSCAASGATRGSRTPWSPSTRCGTERRDRDASRRAHRRRDLRAGRLDGARVVLGRVEHSRQECSFRVRLSRKWSASERGAFPGD